MAAFEGYETLLFERDGKVLVVTLNRPERLNAVDATLHTELTRMLGELDQDEESNVMVLTGAGRAFSAGGDVKGMSESKGASAMIRHGANVRGEAYRIVASLLATEKPLVAMINGPAIGIGATIALLCDITVAADDAKIADTHVKVGLVAGDGGTVIWPALLGPARAKRYLMRGEIVAGAVAERIGLVNFSRPADELRGFTMQIAHELAELPPFALRATKAAVNRSLSRTLLEQMDIALAWEELSMTMADHKEAAAAFVEKRKPHFTGR